MLKWRLLTALVLVPITLLVLFFLPPLAFGFLTAFVTLIAANEWAHLMQLKTTARRVLYLIIMACALISVVFVPLTFIFMCAFLWWLLVSVLVFLYPYGSSVWYGTQIQRGLAGIFVLVPCWASINYLRNESSGIYKLLFLFVLIWGADIGAYFVGKKWGHTKLASSISPGKTWEGLLGALIFAICYILLAAWICEVPYALWGEGLILGTVTVLFSVIGDLFESMMKRKAGVKDSGNLLPGHGGLLDRIDSLTAAGPIFALGTILLGKFA